MRIEAENVDGGRPFVVEFEGEISVSSDGEVTITGTDYDRRKVVSVTLEPDEADLIVQAFDGGGTQ